MLRIPANMQKPCFTAAWDQNRRVINEVWHCLECALKFRDLPKPEVAFENLDLFFLNVISYIDFIYLALITILVIVSYDKTPK